MNPIPRLVAAMTIRRGGCRKMKFLLGEKVVYREFIDSNDCKAFLLRMRTL